MVPSSGRTTGCTICEKFSEKLSNSRSSSEAVKTTHSRARGPLMHPGYPTLPQPLTCLIKGCLQVGHHGFLRDRFHKNHGLLIVADLC